MSIRRAPLVALVAALLLVTGVPGPRLASAGTHAQAARRARKAHKRLVRAGRRKGLASLPAVSGALASHAAGQGADVVGTPPALVDIADGDPSTIFWRPGVVAAIAGGTPTPEQCGEFWAGQTDGVSAGLGACRMAERVGQSFGRILQSENSLCYMRRFPTPENVAAGGVQVVSGDLPGDNITHLFRVPPAADRVGEVRVSGQEKADERVLLRVASAAANHAAGNLYKVDIWFCPTDPAGAVRGVDHLTLDTSGRLLVLEGEGNDDSSVSAATVTGYVVGDGPGAAWDTTRARTADVLYGRSDGTFKSSVEIADDVIRTWSWEIFGGDWRSFTATRFSGSGPTDVRFLAGAFAETSGAQSNVGTAEYRDPIYVAAPGLDLAS